MSEIIVYRIEVEREADGRYFASWESGDGTQAGCAEYAATPVGALANLCATLTKLHEDEGGV